MLKSITICKQAYRSPIKGFSVYCFSSSSNTSGCIQMSANIQDSWVPPKKTGSYDVPPLRVYNSLTRTKDEFIPNTRGRITWYNCGPTVYDASHIGHARNYVTQDIIRRILKDHFGYSVHFVMNITDIDDKIINRAREAHLFSTYREEHENLSFDLISTLREASELYFQQKLIPLLDSESWSLTDIDKLSELVQNDQKWVENLVDVDKVKMHLKSLQQAQIAIIEAERTLKQGSTDKNSAIQAIDQAGDVIQEWLGYTRGASVTDHSIFRKHAAFWEKDFFKDMSALNVESPTTVTRVSDYVTQIVDFVEKIIQRGYAYESNGSVYFDTEAFDGAKGEVSSSSSKSSSSAVAVDGELANDPIWKHVYAKLQPWSKNNKSLMEEGEGALSLATQGKRSFSDFALWKLSKPGEPFWPSPWGNGRPGWHIECSVMASDVLGGNIDVHSGGIDLAFPHHDNEIAQSEAYHGCRQWINYFLHTGHLHIEGSKMSKSLKNFITIKEALSTYSPRQLRLSFLQQLWNANMNFSAKSLTEAKNAESTLNNFFTVVKALLRESRLEDAPQPSRPSHDDSAKELLSALWEANEKFDYALRDSFNTPEAMSIILELVSTTNTYLKRGRSEIDFNAIESIARWVTKSVKLFGLSGGNDDTSSPSSLIGWGSDSTTEGGRNFEEKLMPYLRTLSTFRDEIRKLARSGSAKSSDFLNACDSLRDNEMIDLGVMLDDQDDGRALVKLVPKETLLEAREEKLAAERAKEARKEANKAAQKAKLEKGKIPPEKVFLERTTEFSKWDDDGIPTHDYEGIELSKKKRKGLKKEWDAQAKLHKEWIEKS